MVIARSRRAGRVTERRWQAPDVEGPGGLECHIITHHFAAPKPRVGGKGGGVWGGGGVCVRCSACLNTIT